MGGNDACVCVGLWMSNTAWSHRGKQLKRTLVDNKTIKHINQRLLRTASRELAVKKGKSASQVLPLPATSHPPPLGRYFASCYTFKNYAQ